MAAIPNKRSDMTAPTPQNTPASAAPISSRAQAPGIGSIKEEDFDKAAAARVVASNPALVAIMQQKLGGLVGRSSGYIESLPPAVRRRVAGLKGIQKEHSKLEAQFQEEVLELEKKYFVKFTPLYQKRAKIVNGGEEPTEDEVTAGEANERADEEDEDEEEAGEETMADVKAEEGTGPVPAGIPEFWLSAMKNQVSLAETITESDEQALKRLTDIRMEYLDKPGFRLLFEFADNDFFSNKVISKTYYYQEENGYGGDFIYDHAQGEKIDWKPGKDLTVKIESKRQRNKNTKQTRVVKKTVPCESFFNFFAPPKPPVENASAASDIEERLELDYQLGEDIKEKLIPRAIDWFTGEALQYEAALDDFEEAEFEDEDDEEDEDASEERDEDEESDEEEDGSKPKQEAAECRQS